MPKVCLKRNIKGKGFTLIELLVVVLIIGILATVALPQYQKAVAKVRFMELVAVGDALRKAEDVYYLANGKYTDNPVELDVGLDTSKINLGLNIDGGFVGHAAAEMSFKKSFPLTYVIYFYHHAKSNKTTRYCRVHTDKLSDKALCESITGNNCDRDGRGYVCQSRF